MVEHRSLGAVLFAAVVSLGIGCDDGKKAAGDAAAPVVSADPVESAPPPKPAKPKVKPLPLVNPMVLIPGGSFTMGSKDGQKDEKPRRVRVNAFEMDVYEVTLRSYMACIKRQICTYPDYDTFCNWGKEDRLDHPMNCLNWDQAGAYCKSVKKRLPTEEEWEYAARGEDGRTYGWGNEGKIPKGTCFNQLRKGTCHAASVPIDSPFGLRGMAGNVWEWTASGYNEQYGKKRETDRRVYRGASFLDEDLEDLRATLRNMRPSNVRMDYLGFRCARTPGKGKK